MSAGFFKIAGLKSTFHVNVSKVKLILMGNISF